MQKPKSNKESSIFSWHPPLGSGRQGQRLKTPSAGSLAGSRSCMQSLENRRMPNAFLTSKISRQSRKRAVLRFNFVLEDLPIAAGYSTLRREVSSSCMAYVRTRFSLALCRAAASASSRTQSGAGAAPPCGIYLPTDLHGLYNYLVDLGRPPMLRECKTFLSIAVLVG
jgi:hypothetical protein